MQPVKTTPFAIWLIGSLILTDIVLFALSGLEMAWRPVWSILGAAALLWFLAWLYTGPRHTPRLAQLAELGIKLILFSAAAETLNMLLDAWLPLPLWDARLAKLDTALGFHWPAIASWVAAHPSVNALFAYCYVSLGPEFIALILLLTLSGRGAAAIQLWLLFAATGLATIVIGSILPASGPFVWFHTPEAATTGYVQQFAALRSGDLRIIDLADAQGLVSFPSFHACLALLCMRAVYPLSRPLRWPLYALNLMIITASPTIGGHYLTDILGGLVLGIITILASRAAFIVPLVPSQIMAE